MKPTVLPPTLGRDFAVLPARRRTAPRLGLVALILPLLFSLGVPVPVAGRAQDDEALERHSGYVDLEPVRALDPSGASLEIQLRPSVLRFLADSTKESDSAFGRLLSMIHGIHVLGYEISGSRREQFLEAGEALTQRLKRQGWTVFFQIESEEEEVHIYVKSGKDRDTIDGVFVLVAEPGDSITLINIVGQLDPTEIGRLGRSLNIDSLERAAGAADKP